MSGMFTSSDLAEIAGEEKAKASPRMFVMKLLKIFGAVMLILLFAEGFARLYSVTARPLQSHSYNFDQKYDLAIEPPRKVSSKHYMLAIGDSFVDRDIATDLLTKRFSQDNLPFESLNLGVRGSSMQLIFFLLKTHIESGYKPKVVLVGLNKQSFRADYPPGSEREKAVKDSYLGKCHIYSPQTLQDKFDCLLSDFSYFYRHRRSLKNTLTALPVSLTKTDAKILSRHSLNMSPRGWSPWFETTPPNKVLKDMKNEQKNAPVTLEENNSEVMLQAIVDCCKAQGIEVILVWIPRHPFYLKAATPKDALSYNQKRQFLSIFAEKNRVSFLDMEGAESDPYHFYDGAHMNVEGALNFTGKLANRLLQPPYRNVLEKAIQSGKHHS